MSRSFKVKGINAADNLFIVDEFKNEATYRGEEIATISDIGTSGTWFVKNSNYLAEVGDKIFCDTSLETFTIILPLNPQENDSVWIGDLKGTFETNNLIVARNSELIMGINEDMQFDLNDLSIELVFTNSTVGWKLILD